MYSVCINFFKKIFLSVHQNELLNCIVSTGIDHKSLMQPRYVIQLFLCACVFQLCTAHQCGDDPLTLVKQKFALHGKFILYVKYLHCATADLEIFLSVIYACTCVRQLLTS